MTIKRALTRDSVNLPSVSIYTNISRITVWAIGITILLSTCFGVDVSGIVAALGVGGIAISLGFKDTLANLISGVQVSTCKIMKPGDHIEVSGKSGTVIDTSWRHTTIQDMNGQTVIVPNSIINSSAIVKKPAFNVVRVHIMVKCGKYPLDKLNHLMIAKINPIVAVYGKLREDPRIIYTSIDDGGAKGTIVVKFAKKISASQAVDIKNAITVAVAPYTDYSK